MCWVPLVISLPGTRERWQCRAKAGSRTPDSGLVRGSFVVDAVLTNLASIRFIGVYTGFSMFMGGGIAGIQIRTQGLSVVGRVYV